MTSSDKLVLMSKLKSLHLCFSSTGSYHHCLILADARFPSLITYLFIFTFPSMCLSSTPIALCISEEDLANASVTFLLCALVPFASFRRWGRSVSVGLARTNSNLSCSHKSYYLS